MKNYIIERKENETLLMFHTRIANEIQIMNCRIIAAMFYPKKAVISYINRPNK
jgi:hypothetical protein